MSKYKYSRIKTIKRKINKFIKKFKYYSAEIFTKQPFYEENYRTCIFIARLDFFMMSANLDDPIEDALQDKVWDIIQENFLWDPENTGFIGPRMKRDLAFRSALIKIPLALHCMLYNPIFRLPGFYDGKNSNPRGVYQRYCRAFADKLTFEECKIIENAAVAIGDDYYNWGVEAWKFMKHQKAWSWKIEILHMLRIEKYFGYYKIPDDD